MHLGRLLVATAALVLPGHALAAPLCATLKAVVQIAKQDPRMTSLATGPEFDYGERLATKQIDGFTCRISTSRSGSVRTFYQCATIDMEVAPATIAAAAKCFKAKPLVEKKPYVTTTSFDLQKKPHLWFAANEFKRNRFSFSIIAE